ncbi:MAG: site-specific DNA-methyltransferase [Deltaproteobacteria bacterium]|nr:site-specific DNA-methyltransferase [Deltaproteobacteria bacterium]
MPRKNDLTITDLTHTEARRSNIPTAEYEAVMAEEQKVPFRRAYERRNPDLDPQLVWRGKEAQDAAPLTVAAPPLYIQEKIRPKVLIDDLRRESAERARQKTPDEQLNLFADFNGIPPGVDKTEFYAHEQSWTNRMILGDSLRVMASLAEREGLRGKVQCIYIDPPYGIKFNSNFQWSTTNRDVKDGKAEHITREPEQVKAFRDTWRDGIHSYLSYLRDRLIIARDLLTESGSIFVQIGDENVHRVRCLMDEVFGEENNISTICFNKTSAQTSRYISSTSDYIIWYGKNSEQTKYNKLFFNKSAGGNGGIMYRYIELSDGTRTIFFKSNEVPQGTRFFRLGDVTSQRQGRDSGPGSAMYFPVSVHGKDYFPPNSRGWTTTQLGMNRLKNAGRLIPQGVRLSYLRYLDDFSAFEVGNTWTDCAGTPNRVYVVQTNEKIIQRCILMSTNPGDLVLDPTCGSGTTAYVAEQWGRRWITIDTSRVALALARARLMGARYPWYLLADSRDGQQKEAEIGGRPFVEKPCFDRIRQGFVYERVPHITLKSIANNAEIDIIWDKWQATLEPLRVQLNTALKTNWEEWEIPREAGAGWPGNAKQAHADWWTARIARQREIDDSIASKAEFEYLFDRPYTDNKKVRVAGPFTVESLSPHRTLAVDENDDPLDPDAVGERGNFADMILEELRNSGVQQAHKEDRIRFDSLAPWPGDQICAEGRYREGDGEPEKRAAICIGPEFGTVSRADLVAAAREAAEAGFDLLIACAFNYEAGASGFDKLGRLPVLRARMNAELHMSTDLKNTGGGNLFVIFGEPDIEIQNAPDCGPDHIRVNLNGVDVFHPASGEVRSDNADGIACWFIDTDYNEESFFVRHAYFLGANDPYKSLKTTLKAEIDAEAWESLHSDTSRPFEKPKGGRIAVKVINHLGDEVMKVFRV